MRHSGESGSPFHPGFTSGKSFYNDTTTYGRRPSQSSFARMGRRKKGGSRLAQEWLDRPAASGHPVDGVGGPNRFLKYRNRDFYHVRRDFPIEAIERQTRISLRIIGLRIKIRCPFNEWAGISMGKSA